MSRKPLKDKYERKHRRTWRHPDCVEMMANANFDAVPPLSVAMGLETLEEYQASLCGPTTPVAKEDGDEALVR